MQPVWGFGMFKWVENLIVAKKTRAFGTTAKQLERDYVVGVCGRGMRMLLCLSVRGYATHHGRH